MQKEGVTLRPRRNRQHPWLRRALQEGSLSASKLIFPIFGSDSEHNLAPSWVKRATISQTVEIARQAKALGISAVLLFPVVPHALKSHDGAEACNADNLLNRAVRAVKVAVSDIGVITDVALDPYTLSGHDGILSDSGEIANDQTVDTLCRQALKQAEAGADVIAPSDMMDGRVSALRAALDSHGFQYVNIMSYSAKFASCLYAPFRDAVGSTQSAGIDKSAYQIQYTNRNEALRSVDCDVHSGADSVIIKPALLYLDIVREAANAHKIPIIGYVVSGEYQMLHNLYVRTEDRERLMLEAHMGIVRAGASAIITYAAMEIAQKLSKREA